MFAIGASAEMTMLATGIATGRLGDAVLPIPSTLAYLLVGGYAVVKRPHHHAARRMLLWATLMAGAYALGAVQSVPTVAGTDRWGWAGVLALNAMTGAVATASLAFLVVFPDGNYRTPVDRAIVRGFGLVMAAAVIGALVGVPVLTLTDWVWSGELSATNPAALPMMAPLGAVAVWILRLSATAALALGAALLIVRWARSDASVRRRILWPLVAAAASAVLVAVLGLVNYLDPALPYWTQLLLYLPLVFLMPAALLIGMLWYDLLDLGVVVRRSLLYAGLWAVIAVGYALLAEVAGVVAGQRLPLALAVATTVVVIAAAASGRRWLTELADRLVFGRRLQGSALLIDVGRRLEAGATVQDVAAALAEAVRQGVRAEWVRVDIGAATATAGRRARPDGAEPASPVLVAPLHGDRSMLGEIACGPRELGQYGERDRALLEALARQASLTTANAHLSRELAARVDDLEASRVRLIRAEEAGRRRLERDLHDGVQQQLVALLAQLGLAANQLRRDPALAAASLDTARTDARRALSELQELVRGIHPTLLTDLGLVAAVAERAARLPVPVRVEADAAVRDQRWPGDIEATAYFAISECLTNAVKHAGAQEITVRIAGADDRLRIEVADDGGGFDPADPGVGTGLIGLRDRVEALRGTFTVESRPGDGTEVHVELPVGSRDGAADVRPA